MSSLFLTLSSEALPAQALVSGKIRYSVPHATSVREFVDVRAESLPAYVEEHREAFNPSATAVVTVSLVRVIQ